MRNVVILLTFCLFGLSQTDEVPDVSITVSKPLAMPGDNVTVTCTVENLDGDPGDYVVILYKAVVGNLVATPLADDSFELVATNGFLSPLYQNGKYSINRDTSGSSKQMTLYIRNVTDEESGYFGCQLAGDVLYSTSILEVIEKPEKVHFTNLTANLTLKEGQSAPTIQCQVGPSLPQPHVSMFVGHDAIGWTDITSHFIRTTKTNVNCPSTGGNDASKGCHLNMDVSSNLTSHSYVPNYINDRQYLKCEAHVPGTDHDEVVSQTVMLDLSYRPKFHCDEDVQAKPNDSNVRFTCTAKFNPDLTSANWTFQMNGRTINLKSGEVSEGITATESTLPEMFGEERETRFTLTIDRVASKHFTLYTLSASNEHGTNSTGVQLRETGATVPPGSGASTPVVSSIAAFMCIVIAALVA